MSRALRWTVVAVVLLALPVVPFALWHVPMEGWAETALRQQPTGGIVAAAVISLLAVDIVLPIPSSLVSFSAGAMLGFAPGLLTSAAGMTLACAAGLMLGRWVGAGVVERFVGADEFGRAAAAARRWSVWAILLCRPVPVLAEVSLLYAGIARVPLGPTVALAAFANLGIAAVYAGAGALGTSGPTFLLAMLASLALPGAAWALARRAIPRA